MMAKTKGFIGKGRAILLKHLGNPRPPQYKDRQGPTRCAEGVIGAAKENSVDKIPTAKKAAGRFNEWAVMGLSLAKSR
jgi:hypothetical protein